MNEPKIETLAETEAYIVWTSTEPDGEQLYHIELENMTLHFLAEEWDEFVHVILQSVR
jgi:hypothetical protein